MLCREATLMAEYDRSTFGKQRMSDGAPRDALHRGFSGGGFRKLLYAGNLLQ